MEQSKRLRDYWLAMRASHWAYLVSFITQSNFWGPELARIKQVEAHFYGAHMCALALHHLHTCLRFLELHVRSDADLQGLVEQFRTAYEAERIKSLRDSLEHEENRVAAKELHGHSAYVGLYPDPNITTFHGPSGRLKAVSILDEDYAIEETVAAALQLERPMQELANKLSPYQGQPK